MLWSEGSVQQAEPLGSDGTERLSFCIMDCKQQGQQSSPCINVVAGWGNCEPACGYCGVDVQVRIDGLSSTDADFLSKMGLCGKQVCMPTVLWIKIRTASQGCSWLGHSLQAMADVQTPAAPCLL